MPRWSVGVARAIFTLLILLAWVFGADTGCAQEPLINGFTHQSTLAVRVSNFWTFTASAEAGIVVRLGQTVGDSSLSPFVRLYGPDGALLGSDGAISNDRRAVEVTSRAAISGTFTVVVANVEGFSSGGNGAYRLTLATTTAGSPVVVAPDDEGGIMTNGVTHRGKLPVGDMDVWTFTASAGDGILVRFGEATNSSLTPFVRLYGPDGALLGSDGAILNDGRAAVEVTNRAAIGGTFTVVVANAEKLIRVGSGDYRLTLAKSPGTITVAPGDEGGPLNGANIYDGTMDTGDLDVWSFTHCAGEAILLRMDELIPGSSLYPYLRLYGRDGTLIKSAFGASTAQIYMLATNTGTFTVVAANAEDYFHGGNGAYRLTVNGLSDGLRLCNPRISGTNMTISGVGGASGAEFTVFTSPLVEAPLDTWTPLFSNQFSNQFDFSGTFSRTNTYLPGEPKRFFILQQH